MILFDGTDLSKWETPKDGSPAKWIVKGRIYGGGAPVWRYSNQGEILAIANFTSNLRLLLRSRGDSQGRGNSGIFLMGLVEIQVLDCYNNVTYADGYAGSVYGVNPPMVNPMRAPGQFQVL